MNTYSAGGLTPYEKTLSTGEVKSAAAPLTHKGEEPTEEFRKILPQLDRVELSTKIDFTENMMPYHLTGNKNINQYILMMNQTVELRVDIARSNEGQSTLIEALLPEKSSFQNPGCNIKA